MQGSTTSNIRFFFFLLFTCLRLGYIDFFSISSKYAPLLESLGGY